MISTLPPFLPVPAREKMMSHIVEILAKLHISGRDFRHDRHLFSFFIPAIPEQIVPTVEYAKMKNTEKENARQRQKNSPAGEISIYRL